MKEKYVIAGLMSGTSLDGLDIACCEFHFEEKWAFKILGAETISYSAEMKSTLAGLSKVSGLDLFKFHVAFGKFCGEEVSRFFVKHNLKADFIASHGHTVFHQPASSYTFQAGDGSALSAASGLPVVCDFRSMDVALGGQGAPLVPIGDELLFGDYTYCLNLGGIANVSFRKDHRRIASDLCAVNIVLNHLSQKFGKEYDHKGEIARSGNPHMKFLEELDSLDYYSKSFPKSLGREDLESVLIPLFDQNKYAITQTDLMTTAVEHIARQIGKYLEQGNVLVTGGGSFNDYLLERIRHYARAQIIIPDDLLVNYKEALIFAFLGLKRWREEVNCLKSVTGAVHDSIGGAIYFNKG